MANALATIISEKTIRSMSLPTTEVSRCTETMALLTRFCNTHANNFFNLNNSISAAFVTGERADVKDIQDIYRLVLQGSIDEETFQKDMRRIRQHCAPCYGAVELACYLATARKEANDNRTSYENILEGVTYQRQVVLSKHCTENARYFIGKKKEDDILILDREGKVILEICGRKLLQFNFSFEVMEDISFQELAEYFDGRSRSILDYPQSQPAYVEATISELPEELGGYINKGWNFQAPCYQYRAISIIEDAMQRYAGKVSVKFAEEHKEFSRKGNYYWGFLENEGGTTFPLYLADGQKTAQATLRANGLELRFEGIAPPWFKSGEEWGIHDIPIALSHNKENGVLKISSYYAPTFNALVPEALSRMDCANGRWAPIYDSEFPARIRSSLRKESVVTVAKLLAWASALSILLLITWYYFS